MRCAKGDGLWMGDPIGSPGDVRDFAAEERAVARLLDGDARARDEARGTAKVDALAPFGPPRPASQTGGHDGLPVVVEGRPRLEGSSRASGVKMSG